MFSHQPYEERFAVFYFAVDWQNLSQVRLAAVVTT